MTTKKTPGTTQEMRLFLVDKMMDVAENKLSSDKAKSICNISQQVYNTLNVEIKMALARDKMNGEKVEPVSFS